MQMAQQPGAIYGILGIKSCLLMITLLTYCPLYSSSHFTQHAHQSKPFQVVLEQNDGFLNFGVEKFYSHCWYFLQPKSFLEYEWNILLVENICLKKLNYIKTINFRTSMGMSYAHTFSRKEISLRNVLRGEIRCFESQHNVIPSQSLH